MQPLSSRLQQRLAALKQRLAALNSSLLCRLAGDASHAEAIVSAVPRTARAVTFVATTTVSYRAFNARHPQVRRPLPCRCYEALAHSKQELGR
jgi:deoxyribodipyrimidine photolyase